MPYPGMMTTKFPFDRFRLVDLLFAARFRLLDLTERAEQHIGERSVHRFAHDDREDEPAGSVECAGCDEQFVVEDESHRDPRQPGV
jgi:hypothetical protein